jgi:malto-oligosyltrehalose trehalohydrolase
MSPAPDAAIGRRHHRLPVGAEIEPGGVRFRLWAPSARHVDLIVEPARDTGGAPTERRLTPDAAGFCEAFVAGIGAGSRYRYRTDDGLLVPDAASRAQPDDVHGSSEVIDPRAFAWRRPDWRGRPWEETVLYELHVGTFTPAGTFAAAIDRLDHLVDLGVTAIELMPVADFPGRRDWGYNGVALFAPDAGYGRPDDLKALIDAAHARDLMVFLDVVYNHFGPEGNYLSTYARPFFRTDRETPWGAAIAFDAAASRPVRDFFIANALYWIDEYFIDGLRLDAVHAIHDSRRPAFLDELAAAVRAHVAARDPGRHVHLVLENDANEAARLARGPAGAVTAYTAQWNDDLHHALHVLLTGEADGYYADYADRPLAHLGRCLAEGFAYQGEASPWRGGRRRGEPSAALPATAFVAFLQNHDQVGNRALGERLDRLVPVQARREAAALLLLAPMPPLLFMGEEWAAPEPFLFFCDLGQDLRDKVRDGRRREFARFPAFADDGAQARIPDPTAAASFEASRLDWRRRHAPAHAWMQGHYRRLLALRRHVIIPRLAGMAAGARLQPRPDGSGFTIAWRLGDGAGLSLVLGLGGSVPPWVMQAPPPGDVLYATPEAATAADDAPVSRRWWVRWSLAAPESAPETAAADAGAGR